MSQNLLFEIANYLKLDTTNNLMIAGAFHDIGLIGRAILDKESMKKIVLNCIQKKINFYESEIDLL